ncbi:MAG: FKBP-type peptidyl-prolyl cis-trans isomerase [Candidatus Kapabacteria bacterium]|nr:FKBP-type peptidyl-prolyl cis-trans isomerase [Ignavibacteriota bacterium]MCW5885226.1 FKBP-type peptidyl-prolyl cis-trans isomerase [Candidatus Kapabacteria bacterium]
MFRLFMILFIAGALVASCSSSKDSAKKEETNMTKSTTGLQYFDIEEGTGISPVKGNTCVVHYHGTLLDGTVFDSSKERGQPFEFQIGEGRVIKGWDEGVMTMKIGGKRKLVIPPDLAYGPRQMGSIPPNSTLVFEVELLDIKSK